MFRHIYGIFETPPKKLAFNFKIEMPLMKTKLNTKFSILGPQKSQEIINYNEVWFSLLKISRKHNLIYTGHETGTYLGYQTLTFVVTTFF